MFCEWKRKINNEGLLNSGITKCLTGTLPALLVARGFVGTLRSLLVELNPDTTLMALSFKWLVDLKLNEFLRDILILTPCSRYEL